MKFTSLLFNSFLFFVFFGLLTLPFLLSAQVFNLFYQQSFKVAGLKTVESRDITLKENIYDFNGYVSFEQESLRGGKARTLVTLMVFPRQKVTYRHLYTVSNHTNQDIIWEIAPDGFWRLPSSSFLRINVEQANRISQKNQGERDVFLLKKKSSAYLNLELEDRRLPAGQRLELPLVFSFNFRQD